jgi:high-affinity nickel-transport protein
LTAASVLVALLVGSVEVLGMLADALSLKGSFWGFIALLNNQFGTIGYLVIGLFAGSWVISLAVYRLKGYDHLPVELRP